MRKILTPLLLAVSVALIGHEGKAQCFTTSTPTNNCTYGDEFDQFTLDGISATGIAGCSPNGYGSFSTPVWNLNIGQTYNWSATVGSGLYNQGVAIWIDLNNNGQYETTEMLVSTSPALNHSSTITIPTGTPAGTNVRMRVRCAYNTTMNSGQSCTNGVGSYGETEDHYVNLVAPCTNPTVPTLSASNTTICNGGSTTLSIATGTLNDATTWSWYSGSCGGTAAGTGTSISVSPTTTTTYYARGTGGCVTPGSCGSITITVNQPPTISVQPAATVTQCEGSTLSLSVTAANASSYQWYKGVTPLTNVGNISGVNTNNLQITNTTTADGGTYSVVVIANTGCTDLPSGNSVVTINAPVNISMQPAASTDVCDGGALSLSATETGGVSYQWYYGATPLSDVGSISGSNTANLQINPVVAGDAGTYYLEITPNSPCPMVPTNNAVVNVNPRPTATLAVSGATTVCDGTPSSVDVTLTGTGPWTFDYYDGTNTTNVVTSTNPYSFAVTPSVTTTYSITSLMDANCTSIGSDYAATDVVNVDPRPTATLSNNGPSTICNGSSADVDITLTGTPPFDFDYYDGTTTVNVTGYATNVYTINSSPNATTTFSVTSLSDANCVAQPGDISSTATVTVQYPPNIMTPPTAYTDCSGTGASFNVLATGDGLMYQWQLNNNPLSDDAIYSGTNTATLSINDITGLGGGMYNVVVSGSCPPIVTTTAVMLTEDLNNTWDGSTSADWSDASNWSCGTVPIVTTNVLIPTGATTMPMVDIPTAICNSLTIDPGASVMFAGTNNVLEIKAGIVNNGLFDASAGKVTLSGTGAQNIPAITYKNLEIAGGSTKTLDGPATVTGILFLINGYIQIDGYDLTLDVPVQTLGGSSSSFVVTNDTGEIIGRNMGTGGNPDAATFHVGINPGSYTPIMLENLGASDDFSVRVMPDVYEDGYGVNPQMVNNPVVNRTWMVDEAVMGGSYINMTPYWNAIDEINGFQQTNVFVVQYYGGAWIGLTDSANGAPAAGTFGSLFYAFADSIQDFSPFTVSSSSTTYPWPLAIQLKNISAVNAGSRNRVNWSSAIEATGDVYNVERSTDGKVFAHIGSVDAKGTPSAYTYWDETPVTGKNYYRLKMADVNGKTSYSNVVSATVSGGNVTFSINAYPNPVENMLSVIVNGDVTGKATVVLTDMTGKVVKAAQELSGNSIEIDMSDVAQGMYFIKYSDDAHSELIKVNKQ